MTTLFTPIRPVVLKVIKKGVFNVDSYFQNLPVDTLLVGFVFIRIETYIKELYVLGEFGQPFFVSTWNYSEMIPNDLLGFQIECDLIPSFDLEKERIRHDEETKKLHFEIERLSLIAHGPSEVKKEIEIEEGKIDLQKYLGNPREVLLKW